MSSKFSDQVAQGMSQILNDKNFQKVFTPAVKVASDSTVTEGESSDDEDAFKAFAELAVTAKKKKEDDEKSEDDKSDDKKSKKEDKSEDKSDDKKELKKSKKDKSDSDKDEVKEDKSKNKKKSFPFFKKKKADDQLYASALRHIVESFTKTSSVLENMGLEKSSIATMAILNHIIEEAAYIKMAKNSLPHLNHKLKDLKERFKKLHDPESHYDADLAEELDNEITEIEDTIKALEEDKGEDKKKDSEDLHEKLKNLKEKFKKLHSADSSYDADVAEELDKEITETENKIKSLKEDDNDVRGTDLLLGLDDPEAREGFLDDHVDDPRSSAVLEDILTKNPKLVDDIVPGLKSKFNDETIEEQLKNRIKSRLPSIIETPEDDDIESIMNAYNEARQAIPGMAKLPHEHDIEKKHDPLKTKIDELNADDMDDDVLIKKMLKELSINSEEYDDSGEINCTLLAENMADKYDLYEGDNYDIPEYVFDCAVEAAEKFEKLNKEDEHDCDDKCNHVLQAFNLVNQWVKEADESTFEDEGNTKVTDDDLKSVLDVIGGYSDKEINDRASLSNPSDLDAYTQEFYDAVGKK